MASGAAQVLILKRASVRLASERAVAHRMHRLELIKGFQAVHPSVCGPMPGDPLGYAKNRLEDLER